MSQAGEGRNLRVPRHVMRLMLYERLSPGTVRWGWKLSRYDDHGGSSGVTAHFERSGAAEAHPAPLHPTLCYAALLHPIPPHCNLSHATPRHSTRFHPLHHPGSSQPHASYNPNQPVKLTTPHTPSRGADGTADTPGAADATAEVLNTYNVLLITDYVLRTIQYLLRTTYYVLLTTAYRLLTTYYLLRTTYYLLRTTYYLLHTSY